MHPMLNIAIRAVRKGGTVLSRTYANHDKIKVMAKGNNDIVTNINHDAEAAIIEVIQKSYPEHGIIAQERGQISEHETHTWIIDALDGTLNFVKNIPHFAVSIALQIQGKTEVAVIYNPMTDELFAAEKGKGTQLNGYRVRASSTKELTGALIGTGFPSQAREHSDTYMLMFNEIFKQAADMRRTGSTALDLAYIASGRYDGFFEIGLKPSDMIAGELIAREAGATITDFSGDHNYVQRGNIVAGAPKVTRSLLQTIRPLLSDALK